MYIYRSKHRLLSNFYDLFLFFPCLPLVVRSNSSHCQLMDLFKSKESLKESFLYQGKS